eukprot:CAMPEP_0119132618 /NCGR_PEP_ID=MMETSP1310-20130426/11934_1 /TAXON_ID=464262 /ORGANISM="Genus nov. species nov., Strain RCC2339" /LENGTH=357 /DNA_ID=CAMNT_0007123257 /DNA_START=77 /DNA_END=1150 /DNA_ORIENTATION=+
MADVSITTPITRMFGIRYPIILAGMNVASGPNLAAAVTNAGGMGVIGGVGYTPEVLKKQIEKLKSQLKDKNGAFGVDLLLPQVGGSARKTNYDYTEGTLPELIDIIVNSGAKLFVSAVGVPPRWAVDKLHAANIYVMNMIGHTKHVPKALSAGVDLICAQGGEGGGHTGHIATSILLPQVVDLCKKAKSPLTGDVVHVVGAGGIYDGRGLAMALSYGAQAVWVGTRFICAKEAGAPRRHQKAVLRAGPDDTIRTLIYTGRPLRVIKNPYIMDWETNRADEITDLLSRGIIPVKHDIEAKAEAGEEISADSLGQARPLLMGQVACAIHDVLPAQVIVDDMVRVAVDTIRTMNKTLARL